MSLFGFGDIKFNSNEQSGFGPLSALDGANYQYKRESFRYPIDVGAFDKGHYMVFYIREQDKSSAVKNPITAGNAKSTDTPGGIPSSLASFQNISTGSEITNKLVSGVNQIKSSVGNLGLDNIGSKLTNMSSGVGGGIQGNLNSLLNKTGASVKSGLQNIFGQSQNLLKGSTQSTNAIIQDSIKGITNQKLINTTRLTKECVALYMPDTLMFNHTQNYSQTAMGLTGAIATAGKEAIAEYENAIASGLDAKEATKKAALKVGSDAGGALGVKLSETGGTLLGGDADVGRAVSIATLGLIANPMLEMVYQSPNFRNFQFDFMFYPRDEQEAIQVQNIIDRFKYHQAPEYGGNGEGRSLTLRPPSEFDIKFYYGAGENPNIPGIAPGCILNSIDVNYAPNGWSAYEVPGENIASLGRTGMPTAIQLTLQFTETTILTKGDLRNPGGKKKSTSNGNSVPGQSAITPSGTIGPGL